MNPTSSKAIPQHIAIIMDGNGRWAKQRGLPRALGHRAGVQAVRRTIETCGNLKVPVLTLFAFSSENWKRPADEVNSLMKLFVQALDRELDAMHRNGIRIRFIGDRATLNPDLQTRIQAAEARTAQNQAMTVVIAVAYGGRWDVVQAAQQLAQECVDGTRQANQINEQAVADHLGLAGLPEPDLFIRTGGEHRISNFLLWNLAYAELYFCDELWPDFDADVLKRAIDYFAQRERRFGLTSEQVGSTGLGSTG